MIRLSWTSLFVVALMGDVAWLRAWDEQLFVDFRAVDMNGFYYVVVERENGPWFGDAFGPVRMTIARKGDGLCAVRSAEAGVITKPSDDSGFGFVYRMTHRERVCVRMGDVILGCMQLTKRPHFVRVSPCGHGIAILHLRPMSLCVSDDFEAVQIVSLTGTVVHSKRLSDLFTPSELGALDEEGDVWGWFKYVWFDESKPELLIVPGARSFVTSLGEPWLLILNAVDGGVRQGGRSDVMRAICSANPSAVSGALELAVDAKLRVSAGILGRLFTSDDRPLSVRLRAAVALAYSNDFRGRMLVRRSLEDSCQSASECARPACLDFADRHFVLRHVRAVLGNDAIPFFVKELSEVGDVTSVERSLAEFGSASVPRLKEAVASDNWLTRLRAIRVLGRIGPEARDAIEVLEGASKDPHPTIRKAAQSAIEEIDGLENASSQQQQKHVR